MRNKALTPDIKYEDDDILVCLKPAGIASQTADITQTDMVSLVKRYLSEKGISSEGLGPVHRLDQPVTGLMLFAKNEKTLKELNRLLKDGKIRKSYYAIAEGLVEGQENEVVELVDLIDKDRKNNRALIYDNGKKSGSAKKAVLNYRIIRKYPEKNLTLLDIDLKTGRFHQIRAQLAHMGHPVLYDLKYGGHKGSGNVTGKGTGVLREEAESPGDRDLKGIGLYAYRLVFIHPLSKKEIRIEVSEKALGIVDFLENER
ncbi:MAG: RluA family pseudouridine synthase [Lachnospiraceae bacterium]|nr:RluA family pseudouridine synthase [Lachnospiraceae bacterium]